MPRDDSVLPAGHRLSHYRVRRVLGRGGFGITYIALDERDGRQVAVKEYFPVQCAMRQDGQQVLARLGDDHEEAFRWGLERFRDEGRILARFSHPNLVRVIGDFEAHGTHYIVMAYVEGETLSARLAREGPLDEERSLTLVLPVVDGLEQVHAAGYLHRDIKPSNIVIGADGTPVLLDFGAARRALGDRTHSLTAVVSDGYAPLEQYARDSRQGPWTDIYALGAVLYRCLTNRPVPEAPARAGADELVPAAEASPYRLSPELIDALDAALAVLAADRPPTLAAWRQMFGRSRYLALEWPVTAARGDDSAPDSNGTVAGAAAAGAAALSSQRQRLVDWVRRQLTGPAGSGPLRGSPLERYPTGVLHPVDPGGAGVTGLDPAQSAMNQEGPHPAGQPADPQAADVSGSTTVPPDDEDDDSPVGADGAPDSATAQPVGRRRYVPPSSVGVSFYVRGDARLRVTASAASYRRVHERGKSGQFVAYPSDDPGDGNGRSPNDTGNAARARYERTPFECSMVWPEADGEIETPHGMRREVRRLPYRDGDVLSTRLSHVPPATLRESGRAETNQLVVRLDVRRRPYGEGHILTVVFANCQREALPGGGRAERRLFEARLEVAVESGELAEYPRVDPSLLTDEEQEIELQYRDTHIYAVGHGAAANWSLEPGQPPRICSEFMPTVDVPVVTTKVAGLDDEVLVLHDIVEARFEAVLDRFDAFVDSYDEWVGRQWGIAERLSVGEKAAGRICAQMDAARKRMRAGVELLRRNADAALAFRLANRAMLDQMRQHDCARGRHKDVRAYRWRPFQLAFLLAVITSTIDECDPFRDVLDLIWFPTGGGKTEAYLGLFTFLVVWRRLRYGEAGGGTAVLMRYTLRLLTRQQFERAARIVCALELLRRRGVARIGDEPVSVGLWVGGAASPNTFQEAAKQVTTMSIEDGDPAAEIAAVAEPPAVDSGELLEAAPSQPARGADDNSGSHHLVLQSCPWCGHQLAAPHSYIAGPTEFQFLCRNSACAFGDGRPLPCNVVDEALYEQPPTLLVGTIDKFARLAWEDRAAQFFGCGARRPPELVIQDELHLIAGPLGSVAGVYEAGIETVLEQRGVRPKYIASTATIRMAREQVRRLYGREMAVFPPPGLSADDSWFARTDRSRPGRLYVGYLAPGLDQQHCLAPLAAALLAAPLALFKDQRDGDDLLDAWWTQVIYHGSLRGVGASHNAFVTDVRSFGRRLDAERREAVGRDGEPEVSIPLASDGDTESTSGRRSQPVIAQLTSQSTAQENARTFDRLAAPRGAAGCLDAVLATNMISVGVDVDRLAAMVINGQPLTTAEYIQASSRIGRAGVPGIVFANYYRHQARSVSHYENFRPYHESFYRFVEPTSVTPFTYQVRKRALHAALVIALRHGCDAVTGNAAASGFDKDDPRVQAIVAAFDRRCRRADDDAAEETTGHIQRLVDKWQEAAARCRREKRGLQYDCRDNSADRLLGEFDGTRLGLWNTLHSMRNIEDTAVLRTQGRATRWLTTAHAGPPPGARRDA